jgi:hypothetical protein
MDGTRLPAFEDGVTTVTEDLRWRNYVLRQGDEFTKLWHTLFSEKARNVLYILGMGFDERMCLGLEAILATGGAGRCDVSLLTFDEGPESASREHVDLRDANERRVRALAQENGCLLSERSIKLLSGESRRIGGRSVARAFPGQAEFTPYTDVVVDVSALPRGLYFPLIAKLLSIFDLPAMDSVVRNLHVVVAHSPVIDASISDVGVDEQTTFLHGFSAADFEREAKRDQPRIWLPVLGLGQQLQLERIQTDVKPDEICPVLPSPARNPREADDLMLAYRELIFDRLRVEPRNIIYASESNPFEVYRQIVRSVRHYKKALAPLGGCRAVVSAMSSKLSSLGALLAAYELRTSTGELHVDVGVAHVEAQGYSLQRSSVSPQTTLYSLWLAGECYGD